MSSSYVDGFLALRTHSLRLDQAGPWIVVGAIVLLLILAAGVDYGYSLWLRTKLVRCSALVGHRERVFDDQVATWAFPASDRRQHVYAA